MQLENNKTYRLIHPEHNWALFVKVVERCEVATKNGPEPGYRLKTSLNPDMKKQYSGGLYLAQSSCDEWNATEVDSVGIFGNLKKLWAG